MASSSENERFYRLSRHGQDVDNLSWSEDHRLAVTTPELVFVCMLLTPAHSTSSHKPALTLSTASLPPTPQQQHTIELPRPTTLTEHLDPAHTQAHLSHDTLTRSHWSPLHCNEHGGCVLTSLTAGGRVIVYTPPHSQWKQWRPTHVLSDALLHSDFAAEMPPINKALFTFCTAFSWLPRTLSGGRGLVAMATRSGHLVIVEVLLPVCEAVDGVRVVWVESLVDCEDMSVWGCSIVWRPSTDTECLAVGCSDGRLVVVDYPTTDLSTLWPPDSVPIQHLVFLSHHLVVAKGCMLLVYELLEGKPLNIKGKPLTICGIHSLPVSGLVATNQNTVLSSGLDGTVQIWGVGYAKPRPLKTGVAGHAHQAIQGLALSHNALLVALVVNERMNLDKKQGCTLHFISLVDETMATTPLPTVTSVWDVVECVRQSRSSRGKYLQQLLDHCYQSGGLLAKMLTLQESIVCEQSSEQVLARQAVLCECAQYSLNMAGEERGDSVNKLSTALTVAWLTAYNADTQAYKDLWVEAPVIQSCPICECHVTLTEDLLAYCCSNGHSWSVCPLSFVLVSVCSECVKCMQCGGVTNTLSSLRPPADSWLYKVLSQQNQCVYCGGHYEPIC